MEGVTSLRIRTSPPRNNTGTKKVWNGYNWLPRKNALAKVRNKASDQTTHYQMLTAEYDRLFDDYEYYRTMGYSVENLVPTKQKLNDLHKQLNRLQKSTENSIMFYKNIRNATPTPRTPFRTRKSRKTRR